MLPSFLPVPNVADATLRRVQDAVQKALRRVCGCPLLDGVLLTGVALPLATQVGVVHRLGRAPLGFIVVGTTAAARISNAPQGALPIAQALMLQADAATTAALWIF